jgi:ABC-type phosphate transport system substrate-binding protein
MTKVRTIETTRIAVILGMVLCLSPRISSAESPDDILVFINKTMDHGDVSLDELKKIFLCKKTTWSNGQRIVPINAKESSAIRKSFREKVLGMTANEELTYWSNQRLVHQISNPAEFTATTKAVFKLRTAIGYAYRRDVPKNVVKVVLVIPQK